MPVILRSHPIALLAALCASSSLQGQVPEWQASIAKVSVVLSDATRQPGTAIVVARRGQTAYLVTCAHVVEGDLNPKVEFEAVADRTFTATRKDLQDEGKRGLALLVVNAVPPEVRAIPLAAQARPVQGEKVIVAGFPAAGGGHFTMIDAIVSNTRGTDITLSREAGVGFSGGPVLRGDTAIGLVYGEGGFGLALLSNVVVTYLEGLGVSFGDPRRVPGAGQRAATTFVAGSTKVNRKDGLTYVWIPPGTFQMGCSLGDAECDDDEKPAHFVRITKGFWMGQTPVSVGAYKRYSQTQRKRMPPQPFFGGQSLNQDWSNEEHPIVNVTSHQAAAYCEWAGMRLPTEAEWEYAARAGSREARYGNLIDIAWYADNSGRRPIESARIWKDPENYGKRLAENGNGPKPVGQKSPNAWKLYDMLGNVWEWTADWYGAQYYQANDGLDPQGPRDGDAKVLRGGSWDNVPTNVRLSDRYRVGPGVRSLVNGFRCAGN